MKKLIVELLAAALCPAVVAAGDPVPDVRWDVFTDLTSGDYTLVPDASCSIDVNGVLTIGASGGASVGGVPKGLNFTVIAEVSDCPVGDARVSLLGVGNIALTTGPEGIGQVWLGDKFWPPNGGGTASQGCDGNPLDADRHVIALAYGGTSSTKSYVDGELRVAFNAQLSSMEVNAIGLGVKAGSLATPTGMKVYHLALFNRCLTAEEVAAFDFQLDNPSFSVEQGDLSANSASFRLGCTLLGKGASSATVYRALASADGEYPVETVIASGVTGGWSAMELLENLTEGMPYKVRFRIVNDQNREAVVEKTFTPCEFLGLCASTARFGDDGMSFALVCPSVGSGATSAQVYEMHADAAESYPAEWTFVDAVTSDWSGTFELSDLTPGSFYKIKFRIVNDQNEELVADEIRFATALARWDDFSEDSLTRLGLTLSVDASCSVDADGVLTIGTDGAQMSYKKDSIFTIIADVSDCPFSGDRLDVIGSDYISLTTSQDGMKQMWFDGRFFGKGAADSALDTGRHIVALSYNGTNNRNPPTDVSSYVDGVKVVTSSSYLSNGNVPNLYFGKAIDTKALAPTGMKIHHLAIYKTNLSEAEVAAFFFESATPEPTTVVASAIGYAGLADGQGHGIGVKVSNPEGGEGCTYSWSTDGVAWTEPATTAAGAPTFSEAGSHMVWCRVAAEGYVETVVSNVVVIYGTSASWTYAEGDVKTISDGFWTLNVTEANKELTVTEIGYAPALPASPTLDLAKPIDGGYSVVAIGDSAFNRRLDLTVVVLPDTLRSIGAAAFEGCSNLETVEPLLPETIRNVGSAAFNDCSALHGDLVLGMRRKPLVLGERVFGHAHALTSITVNGKISSIPFAAFCEMNAAKTVTILTTQPFSLGPSAVATTGSKNGVVDFYVDGLVTEWGIQCFVADSQSLRLWVAEDNAGWNAWISENVTQWDELDQADRNAYAARFPDGETPVGLVSAESPAVAVRNQWVLRWHPQRSGFAVILK